MDRSVGSSNSSGGNGKLGGALADPFTAAPVLGNRIYVKSGTYSTASGFSSSLAQSPANNAPPNRLLGYSTSRGDNGQPTLQASANSTTLITLTGAGWVIENFILDCNSKLTSTGLTSNSSFTVVRNCVAKNFTVAGITLSGGTDSAIEDCEITGGISGATAGINISGGSVDFLLRNWVHDNVCPGLLITSSHTILWNLITNNTGASSDGIQCQYGCQIFNNTIHGNGRHGINKTDIFYASYWRNNILTSNGGFGAVGASGAGIPADPSFDGNAYWNNTSGARSNMDDTSTNAIDGVAAYTNVFDKTLTGTPYNASGSNDFSLNSTAGAGASCRAGGTPGTWLNGVPTGYLDMGAVQHLDSASSLVGVRVRPRQFAPPTVRRVSRMILATFNVTNTNTLPVLRPRRFPVPAFQRPRAVILSIPQPFPLPVYRRHPYGVTLPGRVKRTLLTTFNVTNTNTLPIRRRVPFLAPFPLHPRSAPVFLPAPYMVRVPRPRPYTRNYPLPRRVAAQVTSITLTTVGLPTTRAKRFPVPAFQRVRARILPVPQPPQPLSIWRRRTWSVPVPYRGKKSLLTTFQVTNTIPLTMGRPRRFPVAAFQRPRARTLFVTPAPLPLPVRKRHPYAVTFPGRTRRTIITTAQITNTVMMPFGRPRRFPYAAYQRARSMPQPIAQPLVLPVRSRRLYVQTYPRKKPLAFIPLVTPLPCLRIKRNVVPALYRQKPQIITAYPPIVPLSVVRRRVAPGPAQIVRKAALGLSPSLTPPYIAVQIKRRVPFLQPVTARQPAVAGHGCLVFGGVNIINSTRRPRVYLSYQPGRRQPAKALFQSVTTQQSTLIKSVRTIR
jgi:hypothetical protein